MNKAPQIIPDTRTNDTLYHKLIKKKGGEGEASTYSLALRFHFFFKETFFPHKNTS